MNKPPILGFSKPQENSGFLLWQVTNLWQREITRVLEPFNLTNSQFIVLASLYLLEERQDFITQIQVADYAHMDPMNTSNIIRTLEAKAYIERHVHHTDTRAKTIRLTKLGQTVLAQAGNAVENFDKQFFTSLESVTGFNQVLSRLLTYSQTHTQEPHL